MKDCPFPLYYAACLWAGCDTQFWEGVTLAKEVLNPNTVAQVAEGGNTPEARMLITEAVATLREREAGRIEALRAKIVEYDNFNVAPVPNDPDLGQVASTAPTTKKKRP